MWLDLEPQKWARLERERTGNRGNTKGRSWEIQSTRGLNRLQHFIIKTPTSSYWEEKKWSPEPCRFVSEGEKSTVRSNRPLIFLSCIKGTILLGGYAGEQALLIFTVYLVLCTNIYIHLCGTSPKIHNPIFCSSLHTETRPCCFGFIVSFRRVTASYPFDKAFQAVTVTNSGPTPSPSVSSVSALETNKMHLFKMNASRSQRAVLNLSRYIIVHKDKRVQINPRVLSPSCLSTSRIKSPKKKKQKKE